jgi:hypothetical protein
MWNLWYMCFGGHKYIILVHIYKDTLRFWSLHIWTNMRFSLCQKHARGLSLKLCIISKCVQVLKFSACTYFQWGGGWAWIIFKTAARACLIMNIYSWGGTPPPYVIKMVTLLIQRILIGFHGQVQIALPALAPN